MMNLVYSMVRLGQLLRCDRRGAPALVASLFAGAALAATPQEAHAQLDRIPVAESLQAAHEVLDALVSAGAPVDQALAVVNDAVTHKYDASQLRQVGAEMREQLQQNIPAGFVVKTAGNAINANYPAAGTVTALNAFQGKVEQGIPVEQAFVAVNSNIVGSGFGAGASGGAGMAGRP